MGFCFCFCFLISDFFERTILCNSLVWSCAVTGRPGLTYQEALESEKKARQNLQSFPEPLIIPVLYLTSLTHRSVHAYMKFVMISLHMSRIDTLLKKLWKSLGTMVQGKVLLIFPLGKFIFTLLKFKTHKMMT